MDECPYILKNPFPHPDRKNAPVFAAAEHLVDVIRNAGHEAYFAGGFARDMLIGRPVHDIDIATNAKPDTIQALFPDCRAFGKSFGVVQVDLGEFQFEVATFRQDADYRDGRHPEHVVFSSPQEDASRRDFTVNGLFYDPARHVIIDYVQGLPRSSQPHDPRDRRPGYAF